jgi:Ca2+-binding EF-hand superfamily protein
MLTIAASLSLSLLCQIKIDLNDDTARQVIVDQEPGQYLGHVTTAMLEDGKTIFATYPKGHGGGQIVLKRSDDGGLTWGERLEVPESWSTSKEVPTLFRTIDSEGNKRFILHSGLYPIRQAVSEDDGATWSELEPIGDYGGIVASGCMLQCKDGSYIAMFHDDGRFIGDKFRSGDENKFNVFQIRSTDGGLTWGDPIVIATHEKADLCEPGIIRSPDGKQLLVLLRENSRQFNSFFITSDDEGITWSEPQQTSSDLTGDRHTAVYNKDGRLFVSFRNTYPQSEYLGDWMAWVGSYDDILNARHGELNVRLKDNKHRWDCAYPGVNILPDSTIVSTTYGHWQAGAEPYILSVRLKLTELDRLADQQQQPDSFETLFRFLDADGDERLEKHEAGARLMHLIDNANHNGNLTVSMSELRHALHNPEDIFSIEDLSATENEFLLSKFDADQDGFLEADERARIDIFDNQLFFEFEAYCILQEEPDLDYTHEELVALMLEDQGSARFKINGELAMMNGVIDATTPGKILRLALEHPQVTTIVLEDVPGSMDDESMMRAAKLVRALGLNTHAMSYSFIASGGVDFFQAGVIRTADKGAKFGVHSWSAGNVEGADLAREHEEHLPYLQYYELMGIPTDFYWFTLQAAPADGNYWMSADDIKRFRMLTQ